MTPQTYFENLRDDLAEQFPGDKGLQGRVAKVLIGEIRKSLELYDDITEAHLKEEFAIEYFSCELQNMESNFRWVSKVESLIDDYYG